MEQLKKLLFDTSFRNNDPDPLFHNTFNLAHSLTQRCCTRQSRTEVEHLLKSYLSNEKPMPYSVFQRIWRVVALLLTKRGMKARNLDTLKPEFYKAFRTDIMIASGLEPTPKSHPSEVLVKIAKKYSKSKKDRTPLETILILKFGK